MNTDKCATVPIDMDNAVGFLIDRLVEETFNECSICVYYETVGDVSQRLERAVQIQTVYDAIDIAVQQATRNQIMSDAIKNGE